MTADKIKEFDNQLENILKAVKADLKQNESNMTFQQKRFLRLTILNITNTRRQMFMDFHGWTWKDLETSMFDENQKNESDKVESKQEEPLTL